MNTQEESSKLKPLGHYVRILHRDIGFFLIGLVVVYSLSGIILIYRNTDFLKQEIKVEKKLPANLDKEGLGKELHMRELIITDTQGDLLYFKEGTYDTKTGTAVYISRELPAWLDAMTDVHKSDSSGPSHLLSTVFGVLLTFMGISSFWMFRTGSKMFRRGIYLGAAGILIAIAILVVY